MWVNAIDDEGKIKTHGAGSNDMIQGLDQDARSETFKPIVVPDGTYMT